MITVSFINGSGTGHGTYNASHTSTVTLSYGSNTLPTPWPVLVASFILSLLVAFSGILFGFRPGPSEHISLLTFISELATAALNTLRAVTAFITAVLAIHTNIARFEPPTALAMLVLSIAPSMIPLEPALNPLAIIAGCDFTLAFLAMALMVFSRYNEKLDYYAKWITTGGNCPIFVDYCSDWMHVGCGMEKYYEAADAYEFYTAEPNLSHNQNEIALVEKILGNLLAIVIIILVGILLLLLLYEIWPDHSLDHDIDSHGGMCRGGRAIVSGIAMVLILMYAAAALPVHVKQQRHSKEFHVADSFGNASYAPDYVPETGSNDYPFLGSNDTVWTDCFNISSPADEWGFLGAWWELHKRKIEVILPVV
jgi:hypothetical protein